LNIQKIFTILLIATLIFSATATLTTSSAGNKGVVIGTITTKITANEYLCDVKLSTTPLVTVSPLEILIHTENEYDVGDIIYIRGYYALDGFQSQKDFNLKPDIPFEELSAKYIEPFGSWIYGLKVWLANLRYKLPF